MNKVKAIFFLVCFLIANSGIAVSVHWCGGQVTHISLFSNGADACSCSKGKKAMKRGCCQDKTTTLKSASDLLVLSQVQAKSPVSNFQMILSSHPEVEPGFTTQRCIIELNHPPPLNSGVPPYLRNRVFLI